MNWCLEPFFQRCRNSRNVFACDVARIPPPPRHPLRLPAFLFRTVIATILPMKKPQTMILLCIFLAALAGCERETEPAGLPHSRFIQVMVELRKAARGVQDSAAFEARKQQVLADAGVTEAQLRAYLAAHIRDLDHLAAVWESINVRLAEEEQK
jgi:hypothetical protein